MAQETDGGGLQPHGQALRNALASRPGSVAYGGVGTPGGPSHLP